MQRFLQPLIVVIVAVTLAYGIGTMWPPSAVNPDPDHTHADFSVWVNGAKIDFSDATYMSTEEFALNPFMHLHDGNGHVVHKHEPDGTFGLFLSASLGMSVAQDGPGQVCLYTMHDAPFKSCESGNLRMFVNGRERYVLDPRDILEFVFADGDKILVTDSPSESDMQQQIATLTDDACLYSKTCPWRGDPPTEGCIADPTVPCAE